MEEKPLTTARGLLEKALGQGVRTSPPQSLSMPATSTGSAKLDAFISGPDHACDGYPRGKLTMLYAPEKEFEDLRSTVLRSCPQTGTLFTMRGHAPDNFGKIAVARYTDPQKLVADLWVAVSQKGEERLLILDDVVLGTTGEERVKTAAMWGGFLPQFKRRLSNRKHTVLVFAHMRKPPENSVSDFHVDGGKAWRYYTAVRIRAVLNAESYNMTLDKCKVSSSQGSTGTFAVKDGKFED